MRLLANFSCFGSVRSAYGVCVYTFCCNRIPYQLDVVGDAVMLRELVCKLYGPPAVDP